MRSQSSGLLGRRVREETALELRVVDSGVFMTAPAAVAVASKQAVSAVGKFEQLSVVNM